MKAEKGIELLMAACKSVLQDDHLGSMMARAVVASDHGDVCGAMECARKAGSINPTHPDPMVMLGLLAQEKLQCFPAAGYFRQAIGQDANNALALWYLACNELKGGKIPEALALLSAAAECEPTDAYAIVTLAWLLQQIGQTGDAVLHIQNCLQKPESEVICPALAWLILCYVNLPQQEMPGDSPDRQCRGDLHTTCRFGVNHKKIFEAIAAKSQGPRLQIENLTIGSKCQLLANPALEFYQQRFGERLAVIYSKSFFDLILGPEL